jgi:hypothetical protein
MNALAIMLALCMSTTTSATIYDGLTGKTLSKSSPEFYIAVVMLVMAIIGGLISFRM